MPTRSRPTTKTGRPRARRGVKLTPTALTATELAIAAPEGPAAEIARRVTRDGGAVLAVYREPLGGHVQLLCALPVERVAPTPFQRDVSDAHVRKLTVAMDRTRRYLDPIIAVPVDQGDVRYWTPNGNHRLTALKELGARAILALVIPEREVLFQILALNVEKAHTLRERALEVVRMVEALGDDPRPESALALELEEPALVTLGFAYRERPRLAGAVYHPLLRRVEAFLARPLAEAARERARRAQRLLLLDDAVGEAIERLKARGFESPYLKAFVVARVSPFRRAQGAELGFDELLDQLTRRVRTLDAARVRPGEPERAAGPPSEAE